MKFLLLLLLPSTGWGAGAYYQVLPSTPVGTATMTVSGYYGMAASSNTPNTFNIYMDGVRSRMGIGNGAPQSTLDLWGTGALATVFNMRDTAGGAFSVGFNGAGTTSRISFYESAGSLGTSGLEFLSVPTYGTYTGYVGIGTTNPQSKLVSANTKSNTISLANFAAWFGDPVWGPGVGIQSFQSAPYGVAIQGLDATDGVTKRHLILQPDGGFVGVGTRSPGSTVTVNGLIESTGGGYKYPDGTIQTTAVNNSAQLPSTQTFTGANTFLSSVSISTRGAHSPMLRLNDVQGGGVWYGFESAAGSSYFCLNSNQGSGLPTDGLDGPLFCGRTGATGGHNVGIGGTSMTNALDVNGGIAVRGVSSLGYSTDPNPAAFCNPGECVWAKSIDGATQSSGCLVAVSDNDSGGNGNTAQLTFTSTTSTTVAFSAGSMGGLLMETCAPSSICRVAIRGIHTALASPAGIAPGNTITFSTTRCQGGPDVNYDQYTIGTMLLAPGGTVPGNNPFLIVIQSL